MKYCSPSYSSALEIRWVSLCAFAKNSQYIVWARASPVWPCMHVHYLPKQSNYLLPSGLKFFPTVASCTICTKSQAAMLLCPPPPPSSYSPGTFCVVLQMRCWLHSKRSTWRSERNRKRLSHYWGRWTTTATLFWWDSARRSPTMALTNLLQWKVG